MDLRALCLGFSGAEEVYPFSPEITVFKVRGKIFAIASLDRNPPRISLKCEPWLAEHLRAEHGAVTPGYHLDKRHWNTVTVDGTVPDQMLRDMVEDSYDLVVAGLSGAKQERLGWRPGEAP